jgi:DNA-directed RNA polymerase subunit RPC12/RpoP
MPDCVKCGTRIDRVAYYCLNCGSKIEQEPDNSAEPSPNDSAVPSVKDIQCPSCGGNDLNILGSQGSLAKAIGSTLVFGAIGNILVGSKAVKDLSVQPIQYKCNGCNKTFESGPLAASPDDVLNNPCVVNFERVSSFIGAVVPQIVYINGIRIGPVKNGQTITFQTQTKSNTLFVTDHHGLAFKDKYIFEARPGDNFRVRFNRKFL